ncbi:unnamed protein product [Closterium sp. NIES-54]
MGKVGDASVLWVWGSHAFVCDTSADKLSARAIPNVFLGFPPDAPGWQFYHPTSRRVFPSQYVTFDESVPFFRLFPYRSAPPPPLPLFLASGPPPVLLKVLRLGVRSLGVLGKKGAGSGGAEPGGVEPGGAEPVGVEPWDAESEGVKPGGAESGGADSWGTSSSGGSAGASPRLSPRPEPSSPQQLREWFAQCTRLWRGAAGAGDSAAGDTRAGGVGATSLGGAAAAGPGAGGAGAGNPAEPGGAGAGCARAGGTSTGGAGAGGAGAGDTGALDPGAGGAGVGLAVSCSTGAGGIPGSPLPAPSLSVEQTDSFRECREPGSCPASPIRAVRTGRQVPCPRPPPVPGTHAMALRPSSVPLRVPLPPPLFLPSLTLSLTSLSSAASAHVAELVDFAAPCRLDYAAALVAEFESASPPSIGGECALRTYVLEDRQEDFECLATAVAHLVAMLLAREGDSDALDIPTPRSYARAITGPYSSQCQTAMDAKMASWKSTGTYVDAVPLSRANIRLGVDYFQTFSPTPKITTLRLLVHVAAQRDYELHSLDFTTAFLQGSLHEEVWLRRPPGFSGSFPACTLCSIRRPVYDLRQTPRKWHDTLRTTLVALGFTPLTADPSLFLRTNTSLPPFYILVHVDDLVFATADTEALTLVKSELQKRHTCTDLGELRSYLGLHITQDRARRTITLCQSHMVHQVLQRFGFQFSSPQPIPLSTGHSLPPPPSDESVGPSGPYPELVGCLITSRMGLVLGGRGPVVLTGHADDSWVVDSATQRSSQGYTFSLGSGSVSWRSTRSSLVLSSSCEAEIYAWAMAAQELRLLTYLLTDLGEQPRSPPVLYVDNKAMIALCEEHKVKQ